jgi:hypothetical protein
MTKLKIVFRVWRGKPDIFLKAVLIGLLIMVSGCARTVVERPYRGENIQIQAQFRGSVDTGRYVYYVIFSNSVDPLIPYTGDYLPFPGQLYNESIVDAVSLGVGIEYYYSLYFSTWSDYIRYQNASLYLCNSGDKFAADTDEDAHFNYVDKISFSPTNATSGKVFLMSFGLNDLSEVGDDIFVNLVIADKSTGEILEQSTETIVLENKISGQSENEFEEENVPAGADLISWEVTIY